MEVEPPQMGPGADKDATGASGEKTDMKCSFRRVTFSNASLADSSPRQSVAGTRANVLVAK